MAIGVGIVGFGRIGREHAGWLGGARGIRAVAAVDATEARREMARGMGLRVYSELGEMLGDAGVGAVLVATPTVFHFEHGRLALGAGKHLMVEKPMALDWAGASAMVEEAKERGLVLGVFQNRRWDLDYLTVKGAVERGEFGRLINVESRLGQWGSCVGPAAVEWKPGWRNEAAYGGGGLYDWGSHFVDQMWRLFLPAKVVRVMAQLRGNVWSTDCDDFARVCLDFEGGGVGMVEVNTTTTRALPRWHVDGVLGSAEAPADLEFRTEKWAELDFVAAGGGGGRRLALARGGLSEREIWERFGDAIRGEGEAAVSGESVLTTMRILDLARESGRVGAGRNF